MLNRRSAAAVITVLAFLIGAGVFSLVFHRHLRQVPAAAYEARDDAVITLSHARNLVEYGFVGVSPSGERIEGFSAPLQFAVAAVTYRVSGFDYATFFTWQMELGTVLLGIGFAALLLGSASSDITASRLLFIGLAIVASAEVLATSRAFLLWHASGMENAYKIVLFVWLLWALDSMLRSRRIKIWVSVVVGLSSLTRADAIVPVSMVLGTFAVLWWLRERNLQGFKFAVVSTAPWVLYMAARLRYFGYWTPNTALVQGIHVQERVSALLQSPGVVATDCYQWLIGVGASLHAFQFLWLPLVIAMAGRERLALERCALLSTGAVACVVQYALVGPARMDPARTVTELALYSTALTPFVLLARERFRWANLVVGVTVLGCSIAVVASRKPDRPEIGWGARGFERVVEDAYGVARLYEIPRPTLANPDLGAVSWHKHFNIIDLGKLGSAVVPRIHSPGLYVSEFAKPDIIQIHDSWSCVYRDMFTSPQFIDEYVAVSAARGDWLTAHCAGAPAAMAGLWVRRAVMKGSGSAERRFLELFSGNWNLISLNTELQRCAVQPGPRPCGYVGRTLFRFVPELKQHGLFKRISAVLAADPRFAVEHAYFTSSINPRWWRQVVLVHDPTSRALW